MRAKLIVSLFAALAAPSLPGPPAGPLAPEAAARLARVEREEGSGTRRVVEEHFANVGAPLDPRAVIAVVGSLPALRTAVGAGAGAAFVSRAAGQAGPEGGRLRYEEQTFELQAPG